MNYVIFEDKLDATEVKIHKNTCGFYKRQSEQKSDTTIWHEGFDFESAQDKAKIIASKYNKDWRLAKCCC
jgi:hypothetical protein